MAPTDPTSASTDYFRSSTTGVWSSISTWQSSHNNVNWSAATLAPGNNANTIVIQAGHTVLLDVNTSVSNTTIALTGALNIGPGISITVPSGKTITNNGVFTLRSDNTGTAFIASSAGSITGNVTVQRFIQGGASNGTPGKRAYRFFSHPFNAFTNLTQLTNQIDITGAGATMPATNANLTQTVTSAASAYWYNPLLAANAPNDAGWQSFTNSLPANAADANAWKVGQGIRVLVRGAKGEGLAGGAYTASNVTLSMSGNVNINTSVPVNLRTNGTVGTGWNLVGNPLPAPIEINAKLKALRETNTGGTNSNIGAVAYVWNAGKVGTTRGGYDMIDLTATGTYILPMNAVVLVQTTLDNNTVLAFTESDKNAATAPVTIFGRNTADDHLLGLELLDSNGNVTDNTIIKQNNRSSNKFESSDGGKLLNETGIYSITEDNVKAAINSLPLKETNETVALGIYTTAPKSLTIKIASLNLPAGTTAYLKDKLLQKKEALVDAYSYQFNVTADTATQGNNRFELLFKQAPLAMATAATGFTLSLSPNPAKGMVTVNYSNLTIGATTISIADATGRKIKSINLGEVLNGIKTIDVSELSGGTYFVQISKGKDARTEKLVIQ